MKIEIDTIIAITSTVLLVIGGWTQFWDWLRNKPILKTNITLTIIGMMKTPQYGLQTVFSFHLYVANKTNMTVHVMKFLFEFRERKSWYRKNKFLPLTKVVFSKGSKFSPYDFQTLFKFDVNLEKDLMNIQQPVRYGEPHYGFILCTAKADVYHEYKSAFDEGRLEFRVTCVDALGNRHVSKIRQKEG